MGSRRLLTSVATGTASMFASRNNDIDGWWAPALLLEALPTSEPDYRVDLLTGDATPELDDEGLGLLGPAFARYFAWSLVRRGIPTACVHSARPSVSTRPAGLSLA